MKVKAYNKAEEVAEFKKFAHDLVYCYQYLQDHIKYGECIIEEKDPTRTVYNIEAVIAKVESGRALRDAFSEFMESYQTMGQQFIKNVVEYTDGYKTGDWDDGN